MDTRATKPQLQKLRNEGHLYWAAIEPICEKVNIYDGAQRFLEEFARVNEAQGLLLAAHWCQSEVCNGGFHQFFSNSTGVLAPEAMRGFELIGLQKASKILGQAMMRLGDVYPRDRTLRNARLKKLRPRPRGCYGGPFGDLDARFYARSIAGAFDRKADAQVRRTLASFFHM